MASFQSPPTSRPPQTSRRARYTDVSGAANRYRDARLGCEIVNIVVGGCAVSDDDALVIATTLGSCIAACIYDPESRMGGMNHFLLPDSRDDKLSASTRYGSAAMEQLINRLLAHSCRRERLRAKVFGGANVGGALRGSTIGRRNAEFVMDYLATEGIPTISWDIGGGAARAVRFFPATGRSQRRLIGGEQVNEIMREETGYLDTLKRSRIEGDIELF